MPMTNAEKQAVFREKRKQELSTLSKGVISLEEENIALRAKLDAAQKKISSLQIKILKLKAK